MSLKTKIIFLLAFIFWLGMAFFVFNEYIYNEKQAKPENIVSYEGTLTGEYVCLPHRDTSGPTTLECAFGLKTSSGEHYALDFGEGNSAPIFESGQTVTLTGTITPIEMLSSDHWRIYDIVGILSVKQNETRGEPAVDLPLEVVLDAESAELVGFNFMLDLISASNEDDKTAFDRAAGALTKNAREIVFSGEPLSNILTFVGIATVPEDGAIVENLVINSQESASLVVGLNFKDGRVLKQINLVAEDNQWKVDSVSEFDGIF